jgi:radical SAM/Cys-rich protein
MAIPSFREKLLTPLKRAKKLRVLQLNLGKLCNMTCSHCHVDAGPHQGASQMGKEVVEQCLKAIERLQPEVVDLTGGAPELHQEFKNLVLAARSNGCQVINRTNLTVLLVPALSGLAAWLAEQQVQLVASLPSCDQASTDLQRGPGTWEASIKALRHLNQLGYGKADSKLELNLMSNPSGESLQKITACDQKYWHEQLGKLGISFNNLIGLNNMPIARFLEQLEANGRTEAYMRSLVDAFNPASICGLMCKTTLSVAADGSLYDCDFNQMLNLSLGANKACKSKAQNNTLQISNVNLEDLCEAEINLGNHCYGCSAGQGSSCGGALT